MTTGTIIEPADVDRHIEECDVCGDGKGVCLAGTLLSIREVAK